MQSIPSIHQPSQITVQTTRQLIHEPSFCHRHRAGGKQFTRRRRLTFMNVVALLRQKTVRSIQLPWHDFFQALAPEAPTVTPAAGCEARWKLRPTAFLELNERAILDMVYRGRSDLAVRRWKDLRLLGIDSSLIRLPNRPGLGQELGWVQCSNPAGSSGPSPQGRLSALTDRLNRIAIHTRFVPWQPGEREVLATHLLEASVYPTEEFQELDPPTTAVF